MKRILTRVLYGEKDEHFKLLKYLKSSVGYFIYEIVIMYFFYKHTKKHFFYVGYLFILNFVLLGHYPAFAYDEDNIVNKTNSPMIIDCSLDQINYGETVALFNQQFVEDSSLLSVTQEKDGRKPVSSDMFYAVLCRTNGEEINFDFCKPVYVIAGPSNCYTLYFLSFLDADKAVEELSGMPEIRYAEIDSSVEACQSGEITFHSWGAETMQYGSYLDYAVGCPLKSVTVAVIDSGLFLHPMYADRVLESGYDYVDADRDATNDLLGHGTNVAGIIADCTQGFPVYFYPIRILNAGGSGSVSNTINAVREATQKGVDVINLSLASKSISKALDEAIIDALDAGITVVAAAGNNSIDTIQISPAHITAPGFIVVGAADADENISAYSNYGQSVDLYAYGTGITCCSIGGGYTKATGTSFAAPHITALVSLLCLTHEKITPENIEMRIKNTANSDAEIMTPRLSRIIPDDHGFSLSLLRMNLYDRIQMPLYIRPFTAMEPIQYQSDNDDVIAINDGILTPVSPGEAVVIADCLGLPAVRFTVLVMEDDDNKGTLELPFFIKKIEQEAFSGCSSLIHVKIPEGVETIGNGAFDNCDSLMTIDVPDSVKAIGDHSFSGAVVICSENSTAEKYVKNNHLQYITHSN